MAMIDQIGSALGYVIGWVGDVVTALISGEFVALLPVVAVGIAIGVLGFGIRTIKSLVWGI